MTSKRKEILSQSRMYSVSTFITQFITLIAALLTRKFLGPIQMGIWSTLQILVDYSKYTAMGTMSAVSIEIPYWVGKGDTEKSERIKNTAFTFVLYSTILFCGAVVLFAVLTRGRFSPEITYGLLFVSVVIFLQRINNLLIALLRCYKKFHIEAGQMIWSSIVNAILVALLAARFRMYGFIVALGLSFAFNIGYILLKHRFNFRWRIEAQTLRPLVVFGFPLMLIGLVNTGYKSLDKIIIAKMLGFEDLGFYSIALMVCSYMSNFWSAIGVVLVPHFQEKFGENDRPADLENYLFKTAAAFSLVLPLLISLSWVAVPYLVRIFLPKFIPGIPAMKILSLSMFFVAMTQPYQDFLVTIKKHLLLFPILFFSIFAAGGLSYLAIRLGYGLQGVAAAMTLSSALNLTVSHFVSSARFTDARTARRQFLSYGVYFAYMVSYLLILNQYKITDVHSWWQPMLQGFFALVFYAPFLFVLNKQFSLFKNRWKN